MTSRFKKHFKKTKIDKILTLIHSNNFGIRILKSIFCKTKSFPR